VALAASPDAVCGFLEETSMGDSTTLKNHKVSSALRSDRNYVAFEEGTLHSDLSVALRAIAGTFPQHELKSVLLRIAEQLEKPYDENALVRLEEEARKVAWRSLHGPYEQAGCAVLMLASFIGSGNYIKAKKQG
jgi:hypothetical protein